MHADDMDLVREFAENGSDDAFATLVRRHIDLVYSVALRRLDNAHEAEEVTQVVFIILATKAGRLRPGTVLSGWLYQTAQLTSANFQRAAQRREAREQNAFMQFAEQSEPAVSWHRLGPQLEEAMARLGPKERDAVVLRFFENRTVREVAAVLGLPEAAVQKRVNRATDKLRKFFVRRGIQASTGALVASLGTHAVQAAPAGLAVKVAATAVLKGAVGGGSMFPLIKTTLKLMAWTKAKTAIVIGTAVILTAGTTTTLVVRHRHPSRPQPDPVKAPAQIGKSPGDFAPDKLAFMGYMNSIKMAAIPAFIEYAQAHQDEIPQRMADLQPYLPPNTLGLDDDLWEILASGKLTPQLTQKNVILFQQKHVPEGQYGGLKIIGYTDGHFTGKK